jgi:hypothetical protein
MPRVDPTAKGQKNRKLTVVKRKQRKTKRTVKKYTLTHPLVY